ncbi:DNA-binding protein (plasmid) [Antarctobacter heliothermus]|uniref:DNA-binding protein n=1 Tax=Antarctobacter heliothermus TaxID=74033 RepID=A0A222EBD4_9RHOB|nr:OB-fold domain-containing protein [Antarctobacter heliothermus]ASP23506.1 DNA-binding protein [Antarctobacter heliothermus]
MGPQAEYFDLLTKGQFRIQRCNDCTSAVFYPRTHCPECGGTLTWATPKGTGVVYSTTIIRRKPEHGGDYGVALVDLSEGVRMMAQIVDCAPEHVHIGMPVRYAGIGPNADTILYRPEHAA